MAYQPWGKFYRQDLWRFEGSLMMPPAHYLPPNLLHNGGFFIACAKLHRTTLKKPTARQRIDRLADLSLDRRWLALDGRIRDWDGGNQSLGVGVQWVGEHGFSITLLDDLSHELLVATIVRMSREPLPDPQTTGVPLRLS